MAERETTVIDLAIADPTMMSEVLERVVSAAATMANMQIDRLMNALTVVDALAPSAAAGVSASNVRHIGIAATEGQLEISFDRLSDSEAESVRNGAALPEVGSVLDALAANSRIERDGEFAKLVVSLD